jgi:L-cystine uptake protein TcyP (sodium:dicarboxylate symporter family)
LKEFITCYIYSIIIHVSHYPTKKENENKIKELRKVVASLTQLALEIETLLAVIKIIVESLL